MNTGTAAAVCRGATITLFFLATAAGVALFMSNPWYIALFAGIGCLAGTTEFILGMFPDKVTRVRRTNHVILASGLVVLALSLGINFQFNQIILDLSRGVVTGAAIQFVAARLVLPWLFGNIFCSRACWDGAAFDLAAAVRRGGSAKTPRKPHPGYRSLVAWLYLAFSVAAATWAASQLPPSYAAESARWRFGVENAFIVFFGLAILPRLGGRSYCRHLCPFLTLSGIFARFSLFKITPDESVECDRCGACSSACPMGIDVRDATVDGGRLSNRDCLLCESCVEACRKRRLRIAPPRLILRVFAKKGI